MRKFILALLFLPLFAAAQAPQAFDFQGIARDAAGDPLPQQAISLRLTIVSGSPLGPALYQEVHGVTTNAFGLFRVAVGEGAPVSGTLAAIDWGAAAHYLQVEIDASGGSSFVDMGATQLLSVPYALYANGIPCPTTSLLGDTLFQGNGCYVIIPGISAANGGCKDLDGDGVYDHLGCSDPIDCDDLNPTTYPGAQEICGNGIDDDCDGGIDNHPTATVIWYLDADGDGFGDPGMSLSACAQPPGHVSNDDDCDDGDADVFPCQGCSELCSAADVAVIANDQAEYLDMVFVLLAEAFMTCGTFSGPCVDSFILQNLQNEYAGQIGDGCHACALEYVHCFLGECLALCISGPTSPSCLACQQSSGCLNAFVTCVGLIDSDGDGWAAGSDCDDTNAAIRPNALEICDGLDNDCDGSVDEGVALTWYPDLDEDGFGDFTSSIVACTGPPGYVDNPYDCDDADPDVFIGQGCPDIECGFAYGQDWGTCGLAPCVNGVCQPCPDLDGDGWTECDGDCDDTSPTVYPLSGPGSACSSCTLGDMQYIESSYLDIWNISGVAVDQCAGLTGAAAWSCLVTNIQPFVPVAASCLQCVVDRAFCVLTSCSSVCDPWLLSNGTLAGSPDCNQCATAQGCHADFAACTGIVDADGDGVPATSDCDDNAPTVYLGAEELCDGVDNDCNGLIDEGFDLNTDTQNCGACGIQCPSGSSCVSGVCMAADADGDGFGTDVDCDDQNAAVFPGAPEQCDGIDNDCDGIVDEGNPGGGVACNTGLPGQCAAGTLVCQSGILICVPNSAPGAEVCDGIDNDCDGIVDEGNPGGGVACNTGLPGQCAAGTLVCQSGMLVCVPNSAPGVEICDGIDNDCDGIVDEGNPGGGGPCNTGLPGQCAAGTLVCQSGMLVCVPNSAPGVEVCDGIDNDCDGIVDEGNPGGGGSCNTGLPGQCATGTLICQSGMLVCVPNNSPSAEICDGVDNDCDGMVDEGFNVLTDPLNCGFCGNACTLPNAVSACNAGVCMIGFCLTGYADCNGLAADGCETFVGGGGCP